MIRKFSKLIASLILAFPSLVNAQVNVEINQVIYSYETSPRLTDVLTPIAFEKNWYWPAAKLFNMSTEGITSQRKQTIDLLGAAGREESARKKTYQHLINQIKSWNLANKIELRIDYDLARFKLKNNPKLQPGEYKLSLSARPSSLLIFGVVDKPLNLALGENVCIFDLIATIQKADNADRSIVYVIEPSGKVIKVPVAYWNKECVVAKPGSMIYIPLEEEQIFTNNSKLNHAIAHLAKNRID